MSKRTLSILSNKEPSDKIKEMLRFTTWLGKDYPDLTSRIFKKEEDK